MGTNTLRKIQILLSLKKINLTREVFAESNLIVTDYSSSSLDFSNMRKPVVYCQFDKEEFFSAFNDTNNCERVYKKVKKL
ncbi:CDP-glycerol glycerophosphotransferase family protein [Bacillus sp. 179-C3.3 HS]|uniref:CDP-glycerol glycerophosphotransferase family protein n=1 Tax=Bacillus sp. 179-C3.3 HS TaxID=3232162 RepID=UPI0039A20993